MSRTTLSTVRPVLIVAVVVVVAVVLAGCGSDDAPTAAVTPGANEVGKIVETVEPSASVESAAAPEPTVTEQPQTSVVADPAPEKIEPPVTSITTEPAAAEANTVAKAAPAVQTPPAPEPKVVTRSASHLATINFFEAMLKGDEEVAMTLVHGTDAQKQAVRALTLFQKAGNAFKASFLGAYGEEAWATFNDPEHLPEAATSARPPFNASVPVFDPRDLEQIRLYQPQENGDVAVYPSEAGDMRLVRQDGKWRVDAATVLPTRDEDPAPAEKMMADRAEQINRFAAAIGMDGVTPDDIDVELSRAIIEASYGIKIPEPHRFDVTELK